MEIKEILTHQKSYFKTEVTKDINLRIHVLNNLKSWIQTHDDLIEQALYEDLHKSKEESYISEIGMVLHALNHMIKHIKKYSKKHKVSTPLHEFYAKSYYIYEPYGQVCIFSPWNYPFLLSVEPLIGAIAAGNCVILKPSEYANKTAYLLKQMVEDVFDSGHVQVVLGDNHTASLLLKEKFDYIFFTGSPKVGQMVYEAASKHLTPVTLELGGKSPCIISDEKSLKLATKRMIFGKFLNAGQTCISPDYLFVDEKLKFFLYGYIHEFIKEFFGDHPLESDQLVSIINQKHFNRLINYLKDGEIVLGGNYDTNTLKIEPTILENVDLNSSIMNEEIFGPILPIFTYKNIQEVINYIESKDKPLALYLFSQNKKEIKQVLNLSFGGGCINDTLSHLTNDKLPFGGVGLSGMGQYHGFESFKTFSHQKSILHKTLKFDFPLRYYPFNEKKLNMIKKFLK